MMPNRIIKESVCTSDSIDKLDWFEEVLFYRLMVSCDDYGRFDGRTAVIKNRLFPLKESLTMEQVSKAMQKLVEVGLVCMYEVDNKPYMYLPTWEHHQTIRAKKSKYPVPNVDVKSSEIICNQMQADVAVIQSNTIRNPNTNPNPNINRPDESDLNPQADEVIDYLNMRTGSNYRHSESSRKNIRARLREKFTVQDCKDVIDKKCVEWMNTDMQQYLNTETLFRPSHFEKYLNQKAVQKKGQSVF